MFLDCTCRQEYCGRKSKILYVMKKFIFLFLLVPSLAWAAETLVISYEAREGMLCEVFVTTTFEGNRKVITYNYNELAQLPRGYVFSQAELNELGTKGRTTARHEIEREEGFPWLRLLFGWKVQKETYFVKEARFVEPREKELKKKFSINAIWLPAILMFVFSILPAFARFPKPRTRVFMLMLMILFSLIMVYGICWSEALPAREAIIPGILVLGIYTSMYAWGARVRYLQASARM